MLHQSIDFHRGAFSVVFSSPVDPCTDLCPRIVTAKFLENISCGDFLDDPLSSPRYAIICGYRNSNRKDDRLVSHSAGLIRMAENTENSLGGIEQRSSSAVWIVTSSAVPFAVQWWRHGQSVEPRTCKFYRAILSLCSSPQWSLYDERCSIRQDIGSEATERSWLCGYPVPRTFRGLAAPPGVNDRRWVTRPASTAA